jgi:hypothetical protein
MLAVARENDLLREDRTVLTAVAFSLALPRIEQAYLEAHTLSCPNFSMTLMAALGCGVK